MAVTVIMPGRLKKYDRMEGKCSNCDCVVECQRHDASSYAASYYTVKCPTLECGKDIVVIYTPKAYLEK